MTRRKLLLIAAPLAVLAISLAGWRIIAGRHHHDYASSGLQVKPIDKGEVTLLIKSSGTLNPVVLVDVGTQVSGSLSKLYVDYNSPVKQGQVLAELDQTLFQSQLHQDEAALTSAETNLKIAQRSDQRVSGLLPSGYVAQSDVDTADNALASAQAQVQAARAAVEHDHINLGYSVIRSPVAGVVISRSVNVGQTVAASFQTPTLFVIAQDLTRMQIDLNLDEADVGHVHPGQAVDFTVEAFPDRTFHGTVRMVRNDYTTTQNVVTYDVVIDTRNPDLVLRPGMTASAAILTDKREGVLRVPNEALQIANSGLLTGAPTDRPEGKWDGSIYMMQRGQPMQVFVKLGLQGDQYTEVLDSSVPLDEDTRIATGVNAARTPPHA